MRDDESKANRSVIESLESRIREQDEELTGERRGIS